LEAELPNSRASKLKSFQTQKSGARKTKIRQTKKTARKHRLGAGWGRQKFGSSASKLFLKKLTRLKRRANKKSI